MGAGGPHCDANIRLGKRRRVIHTVPNHHNRIAPGLILLHNGDLVLGQEVGAMATPRALARASAIRSISSARNRNSVGSQCAHGGQRLSDLWTHDIPSRDYAEQLIILRDEQLCIACASREDAASTSSVAGSIGRLRTVYSISLNLRAHIVTGDRVALRLTKRLRL